MDQVAERSTGQIPRAALHVYLPSNYDNDDTINVNRHRLFHEFMDLGI